MWNIIIDKLGITDNTQISSVNSHMINCNHILTNSLLNKTSFIEADLKRNKEDYVENIKVVKQIAELNNKTLEARIENLEDENLDLKTMLLKTTKHIIKKDKELYGLKKIVSKLNEKIDRVLQINNQPKENNNEEILEQISEVDDVVTKLYHYKKKRKDN